MLADIRAGKVGAVVVWDLDRLHRRPIELEYFMQLADDKRLALATVTGDCDLATDNGRLFARIKGAVAMAEVERKSARQKRANKQIAETDARPWWPNRPFGYTGDPHPASADRDRWWVIQRDPATKKILAVNNIRKHPKEAKLLKAAYTAFNAGTSIRALALQWNAKGVTTPTGKKWTGAGVHHLLAAARNAGLREYGGELVVEKDGPRKGLPKKGTWPEIVSEEVWRQAHTTLKDPARRKGGSRERKHLLSGLARCGVCRGKMAATKNYRGVQQYICRDMDCRKVVRVADKVDALVTETVVRRLSREDAVELLRPPVDPVDAEALREERRALQAKLVQLGKDFATAPPEFTQSALASTTGRLAEIDELLTDPGKARVFEGVIGAKDVRKAFTGLDLGRRRTIVDALLTVTVKPVAQRGKLFDRNAIERVWKQ
jgi:DNA invertase Pin-like site-specific DNA recombinase